MKNMKKFLALGLVGAMAATTLLTGCGSKKGSSDPLSFTALTVNAVDSVYYKDFDENPAVKYWLAKEWDAEGNGEAKKITIDFTMPPEGSTTDYVNTLMATSEYPDLLPLTIVSDNISTLYEDGVILDLADYIDQYMPNLKAWMDENPSAVQQMTTIIDGESHILYLPDAKDTAGDAWGSYCYRRDWIAKYGTNPETGAPFTYEYVTGDDGKVHLTDDIVFPSWVDEKSKEEGLKLYPEWEGKDPLFISDWEWMFDIFAKAIKDQNIAEGYCMQLTSGGYAGTGDLDGGFGGTLGYSYYVDDDGQVQYGPTTKYARAYLECVTNWNKKNWINKDFEENVGELWFSCDTDHVYTGQVGMWYGLTAQWGNNLEEASSPYTEGIYVSAAPQPVNDVYGDDDCKYHEPMCFYEATVVGKGVAVTEKAKDKDIATLLTAYDYLYSTEGAMMREVGMTDKQIEELRSIDSDAAAMFDKYGLSDGCATVRVEDDGTEIYVRNPKLDEIDDGVKVALGLVRLIGGSKFNQIDYGRDEETQHNQDMANLYTAYAAIGMIPDKLTSDQAAEKSVIDTQMNTELSQAIPDFITGRVELNDTTWDAYCNKLKDMGYEKCVKYLNEAAGN